MNVPFSFAVMVNVFFLCVNFDIMNKFWMGGFLMMAGAEWLIHKAGGAWGCVADALANIGP